MNQILPDAIITKAYAPILIMGVIYGALIGWAMSLTIHPELEVRGLSSLGTPSVAQWNRM